MSKQSINILYGHVTNSECESFQSDILPRQTFTKYIKTLALPEFYEKYVLSKLTKNKVIANHIIPTINKSELIIFETKVAKPGANSNNNKIKIGSQSFDIPSDKEIFVFNVNLDTKIAELDAVSYIHSTTGKKAPDEDEAVDEIGDADEVESDADEEDPDADEEDPVDSEADEVESDADEADEVESDAEEEDPPESDAEVNEETDAEDKDEEAPIEEEEEEAVDEEADDYYGEEGDDIEDESEDEEEKPRKTTKRKMATAKKPKIPGTLGRGRKKAKYDKVYNYDELLKPEVWSETVATRPMTVDAGMAKRRVVVYEGLKTKCGQTDENARRIELSIYNFAVNTANKFYIFSDWDNVDFRIIYINKAKSIFSNLSTEFGVVNTDINKIISKVGELDIANKTYYEINPSIYQAIMEDKIKIEQMKNQAVQFNVTDMFKCMRCNKRHCSYVEIQTRSADEPMTCFITCLECGKKWKQN